ncbi:homoserine kinase [Dactylosporangium siamense]|uniref:Homoserine kinase n=2 Tax=Dactylosporangium siamense TaxID=685454 RepID=A0A919PYH7_9ACTN|nr:homoserine kinase [Dactylosporangium siamense]GIG51977.1 homoserine kinase [Dactylosporangium siamense]
MALLSTPVTVRVPATSANLGPGFDALGLALSLHDEVEARVAGDGVTVEVIGEGAGDLPGDESHLVVRAMRRVFDELGERPAGLALRCRNHIPQARGMGSSSAAIVAGVTLARALVSDGAERLGGHDLLRIAAELEGHPDNVAPCLLGGMTIAWTEDSGAAAVRVDPAASIRPYVFVPQERGLTEVARAALPATVPHADAALNAGRAALLVHAITVDPSHLFVATEDRLHQGYRAPSMPGSAELVATLRKAGVAAVISGAGPSVLALATGGWAPSPSPGWRVLPLDVDLVGALVGVDLVWGTLEHADRDPVAAG